MSMSTRRACLVLIALLTTVSACRGDEEGSPGFDAVKDTVGVSDLGGGDLGPGLDVTLPDGLLPDGLLPDGVLPDGVVLPDVDAPAGTVKALQVAAAAVACDPEGFTDVLATANVKAAVVTSPKFDAFTSTTGGTDLDGYYIADQDGGLWSGIMLVVPRSEGTNLQPGDVVDVSGEVTDRFCNTQFRSATLQVTGSVTAPDPTDLSAAPADWEPYEGMLVRMAPSAVTEALSGGRYTLDNGLIVDHAFDFFLSMKVGSSYEVTGQIAYVFNQFRIEPRSAEDVVAKAGPGPDADGGPIGDAPDATDGDTTTPGLTAITTIQGSALSLGCKASDGDFQDGPSNLTVQGVVTTPGWSASATLVAYGFSDGSDDPLSGIVLTVAKASDPKFAPGDTVTVQGEHLEFFCQTQLDADSATLTTLDLDVPAGAELSSLGADPEQWEGVVVVLTGATVSKNSDFGSFGEFTIGDGVIVDSVVMGKNAIPKPALGSSFESLRGIVRWEFGKWHLSPVSAADVVPAGSTVEPLPDAADTADAPDTADTPDTTDTADTADVSGGPDADGDGGPLPTVTAVASLQQSTDSVSCTASEIQTIATDLVLEGVVTVARYAPSPSVWNYGFSDGDGAWSSISLAVTKSSGLDGDWPVGTQLRVTGAYDEFFCNSTFYVDAVEVLGTTEAPGPVLVADFAAASESWEGSLITVENVKVTSINAKGELVTDKGLVIDDEILGTTIAPAPAIGTTYASVTGLVTWGFNSYRLQIRSLDDLVTAE
ncbi:MAG: hypothetical protein H6744_11545 [Deltaproteobacteria bacterium]|nr:hypothetical protein [Deltaproteobacteria bacterium]MCB9787310.1 hypothetical protein [Deltaproteobacteria bacterium]